MSRKPKAGELVKKLQGAALAIEALDKNPAVRRVLIQRIAKACETAPIVAIHQAILALEMWSDTKDGHP